MPQIETDPASIADAATLVPDARRSGFLPRLFGKELIFVGEASVYNFMQWLSRRLPRRLLELPRASREASLPRADIRRALPDHLPHQRL